jgi:serine/threonine protein kinase
MEDTSSADAINLYKLLEVDPNARPEVIQAAYRALMKIYDPSKPGGNNAIAQALNMGYDTLSDPGKRAQYDGRREDNFEGKIIGQYRIFERIAEGGFGYTYKGEHILLKEPVCIKHCSKLDLAANQILLEETKALWDLRHFALPTMRDLLELEDGRLALVMSYIPGETLETRVQGLDKEGKRMKAEEVAWIADRSLNALMYLHYHGVIHGDIKPPNIIMQLDNHMIVLVDFGLALVMPTENSTNKGYQEHYSSPEQISGSTLIPESDLYSLGMTMIYALSGSHEHVMAKEVPANVPEPLCKFIKRLIVRNPLSRPNWDKEDLCDTIRKVRLEAFGREHSFAN